jgi:hypothetical protein
MILSQPLFALTSSSSGVDSKVSKKHPFLTFLMLLALQRSSKYQLDIVWFD